MPKRNQKRTQKVEPDQAGQTRTNPVPSNESVDDSEIAELAYRRWVDRGCPQGSADDDWFEAEKDLRSAKR